MFESLRCIRLEGEIVGAAAKPGAQAFESKCGSAGAVAVESGDRAHDATRCRQLH